LNSCVETRLEDLGLLLPFFLKETKDHKMEFVQQQTYAFVIYTRSRPLWTFGLSSRAASPKAYTFDPTNHVEACSSATAFRSIASGRTAHITKLTTSATPSAHNEGEPTRGAGSNEENHPSHSSLGVPTSMIDKGYGLNLMIT
jgi:hypothetical protein